MVISIVVSKNTQKYGFIYMEITTPFLSNSVAIFLVVEIGMKWFEMTL